MPRSLVVLVPPSEAKSFGGSHGHDPGVFDSVLGEARLEVRNGLRDLLAHGSTSELSRVLGVRGPLLARARDATSALVEGAAATMPAWRRYSGVVWTHLDPVSLHVAQRRRLLIPSGLYGLNGGDDPIADYRLKMSVRVAPLGHLGSFWRERVTSALVERLKGATVVNLLPREYAASVDLTALASSCNLRHVTFRDRRSGLAVGHEAKAVKGRFARHALESGADDLGAFRWEGWRVSTVGRSGGHLTIERDKS